MTFSILRVGEKETVDGFRVRFILKTSPVLPVWPVSYVLLAMLEGTERKQISSIPGHVDKTVIRLPGKAFRATEASLTWCTPINDPHGGQSKNYEICTDFCFPNRCLADRAQVSALAPYHRLCSDACDQCSHLYRFSSSVLLKRG